MNYELPKQIGRYSIERLIGSGAMGNVFLARDPDLDREVAIKTVRDHGLDRAALDTYLARFRNEARAAAKLQHSNIVAVYDVGEDPVVGPYLVFEYVAGSSLKSIIQARGALPPARIVSIAEQLARALDTAHAAGILHRDIKPDNILVTDIGRAKLADFGIARLPDAALTRDGQFLGTPCYAAPETITQGQYTPTSDLFSYAAVLYEMVAGLRAFPGDDAMAVAHAVVSEPAVPPSRVAAQAVPPEVDAVISRGLSKDVAARFGSAGELARALRNAYATIGAVEEASASNADNTLGTPAVRTTPEPAKLSRGPTLGLVVAIGSLVGIGLIFWLARQRGTDLSFIAPGLLDAGVTDSSTTQLATTQVDAASITVVATNASDAGTDAGPSIVVIALADATTPPPAPDAATVPTPELSPRDREEAAKDAVAEARAAMERNDREAARHALERARALDPGNSDIVDVEGLLRTEDALAP